MNANSEPANRARILLVDDEPAILITLQKILSLEGYEVQSAQSAREGLRLHGQTAFDLAILDRKMPEMNGEELAAELKRLTPSIPLILITGFPAAVTRRELFVTVMGKPFRTPELLKSISMALAVKGNEPLSKSAPPAPLDPQSHPTIPPGGGSMAGPEAARMQPVIQAFTELPCVSSL
ncbi:MAG TPA: response regulator [Chthoniobacter sp.]|jgi:CheY-like chemotaxis protein